MARRGRKRKSGQREPNGRLVRERETPAKRAAQLPHRQGLGDLAADQRAATVLGRLVLRHSLTPEQGLAGETYLRQWRGYLATLAGPVALGNGSHATASCDGCPVPELRRFCKCDHVQVIWRETVRSLSNVTRREVDRVVLFDNPPTAMLVLQMGLAALASHFGLTPRKSFGNVKNATSTALRGRPSVT